MRSGRRMLRLAPPPSELIKRTKNWIGCETLELVLVQCISAPSGAEQQLTHRDHHHGPGVAYTLVLALDGCEVDTLIDTSIGHHIRGCALRPLEGALALWFDGFLRHAGASGKREFCDRVFITFVDPNYGSRAALEEQLGSSRRVTRGSGSRPISPPTHTPNVSSVEQSREYPRKGRREKNKPCTSLGTTQTAANQTACTRIFSSTTARPV